MKYAYKRIKINAPFKTKQCGHLSQNEFLDTFNDDLYARVVSFKNDDKTIIHISIDLLCFDLKHRDIIQKEIRNFYRDDNIYIITSATHTHYANDIRDQRYVDFLIDLLIKEIKTLVYITKNDVQVSFTMDKNKIAGCSRISGYETNNEFTCLLNFYDTDKLFLSIVINNAHPTTLNANVKYFSSEYPGILMNNLSNEYKEVDFSFIQGACGDISSRFVREGQSYDHMFSIANSLTTKVKEMLRSNVKKFALILDYEERVLNFDLNTNDIVVEQNELVKLSKREIETIEMGKMLRADITKGNSYIFGNIQNDIHIGILKTGAINIIFFPNEIFSDYLNCLDLNKSYLVSYSNGYGPYILPPNFKYITYEKYMDISSEKMKQNIIEQIKDI